MFPRGFPAIFVNNSAVGAYRSYIPLQKTEETKHGGRTLFACRAGSTDGLWHDGGVFGRSCRHVCAAGTGYWHIHLWQSDPRGVSRRSAVANGRRQAGLRGGVFRRNDRGRLGVHGDPAAVFARLLSVSRGGAAAVRRAFAVSLGKSPDLRISLYPSGRDARAKGGQSGVHATGVNAAP